MHISHKEELRALLAIAAPICFSQLFQMAMGITDTILLGGISERALAIGGLSTGLFFTICFIFQTALNAAGVFIAQALGKKQPHIIPSLYATSFVFALLLTIPCMVLIHYIRYLLEWLNESPDIIDQTVHFIGILQWGTFPLLMGVGLFRAVLPALNAANLLLKTTILMTALNALLNSSLIYGLFSMPRLELYGSALATTITLWLSSLLLLGIVCFSKKLRPYVYPLSIDLRWIWPFAKLGVPMMAAAAAEMLLFQATTLQAALFGTSALAAHQVALNTCTTSYMVSYALGQAANVRAGFWTGTKNYPMLGQAILIAFLCTGLIAFAMSGLIAGFSTPIAKVFLGHTSVPSADGLVLASKLLIIAGLFQSVDGLQTVGNGILRGMGDTFVPMLFCILGYWAVAFPAANYLAFTLHYQTIGLWIGLAVGLSIVAFLMIFRIYLLVKKQQTQQKNLL
ncbi:MATE family efflux transporter [Entomobacter blattae]|uniref:Multidrug-efflux transporter n=1 Tax=Entomobacter blattae TaxID=2762277 RepID=A0A7H1NSB3_9PROT|nr:MATE family efflux transporter [Entomobacter blattae]QNT78673.1 Multidrug resistance protein NorM [Entomobacter blattae]